MSEIEAGIPLWRSPDSDVFYQFERFGGIPHRAYPVEYARQLEAVAEAAREVRKVLREDRQVDAVVVALRPFRATLDALDAAGSES